MKNTSDHILIAHGGGGRLSRDLIEQEIVARLYKGHGELPDAASLHMQGQDLVFTTDSFVVSPAFFPGGNIGELAVYGTVNDIAVSGAVPKHLSLALILEEGFSIAELRVILDSARKAADRCEVTIVTGDTKVVASGQCDGIYINTAGIGEKIPQFDLSPSRIKEGDAVIVSGTIGEHGLAVMCARNGIAIKHGPMSDSAPVHVLVNAVADLAGEIRFMRDPTRGGLSAVLNEIIENRSAGILLNEADLPLSPEAHSAAEMLGLDPLHVASEGRIVAICSSSAGPALLERWHIIDEGKGAAQIGTVTASRPGSVIIETATGGRRLVDLPKGELLPRIC